MTGDTRRRSAAKRFALAKEPKDGRTYHEGSGAVHERTGLCDGRPADDVHQRAEGESEGRGLKSI